jgi:poly-gamma-glutamate synthesis protein (capsule biosynthesis protein)
VRFLHLGLLLLVSALAALGAGRHPAPPRILLLGDLQADRPPDVAALRTLARDVDVVVVNLEGPISLRPFALLDKQWRLRSARAVASRLAALAPHRVLGLLANNHAGDCGGAGVEDTRAAMRAVGLRTVGNPSWPPPDPEPLVLAVRGQRVAFLAASLVPPSRAPRPFDRAAWEERLVDRVTRLGKTGEVVVCLHWNADEGILPGPADRTLAHRLQQAGARLVAGFHPHQFGAVERSAGGVILYSLGNTALSCPCSQEPLGGAVRLTLGGIAEVLPIRCGRNANHLRVTLAAPTERQALWNWVDAVSVDFNTALDPRGRIVTRGDPVRP